MLHSGFLRASVLGPDRLALEVDGAALSYAALRRAAAAIGATLERSAPRTGSPLAAVFASRSVTAFAGVLGTLFAGRGYVPLNPAFPVARTRAMLQAADCRAVVADARGEAPLDAVLQGLSTPLLIVLPDREDVAEQRRRWARHTVLGARDLASPNECSYAPAAADAVAYLMFTSGSTGTPKGVPVAHRNATHFVDAVVGRYGITSRDRFSQVFEHTFDLSVFDMFAAWQAGACLCCPAEDQLLNPDRFIREARLTVWFSVPSRAVLMKRLGVLRPHRFPSLRWSLFCGEPLPADVAAAWAAAAPQSTIENLYGPTELTVACSAYRWDLARSPRECRLGVVPIGEPLPGMDAIVVDDQLREVPHGTAGELLMTGPQLTSGYWQNPEATERAYVTLPSHGRRFYRTGDRVIRQSAAAPLTYIGRVDHQIKVAGYRVELGEVEATLREEPGVEDAVAVGWPVTATGAGGIVAFVTGRDLDTAAICSAVRSKLQRYAAPHTVRLIPRLPYTSNGKIDRQALMASLHS